MATSTRGGPRPRKRGFGKLTSWIGIRQLVGDLRGSYWFIPSLMATGAVLLALATIALDRRLDSAVLESLDLIGANGPEGARAVLTTVAASMIGVAGVSFSITIAAVAYGASQFAPRLLTNFMRDRGNQMTLGTYIAAFLYCLVVLRAVNDSWTPGSETAEPFVPQIASLVALLLATAGCAVLIYYIHHIPKSIHISRVIAQIGAALNERIRSRFEASSSPPRLVSPPSDEAMEVRATRDGYIQHVDIGHLVRCARDVDAVVHVTQSAGGFVATGRVIARVETEGVDEEALADSICSAFAIGDLRTPSEDVLFLSNELLEIAARALSPGVNDPFTAIACIDRIGAAISELAGRGDYLGQHVDGDGALRVVEPPLTFEGFCEEVLDRLRQYVLADRNVTLHLAETLARVAQDVRGAERQRAIREQILALRDEAAPRRTAADRARLVAISRDALRRLDPPTLRRTG